MATLNTTFGFPNIQNLRLAGVCEELSGLIGCLRLPPTACVVINCAKASETSLLSLAWALDKAWPTKPRIARVSLWQPAAGGGRIEGWSTAAPVTSHVHISTSSIENWQQDTFPESRSLFPTIYWDHVETLSVECSLGQDAEWDRTFEMVKQLKNLKVFD